MRQYAETYADTEPGGRALPRALTRRPCSGKYAGGDAMNTVRVFGSTGFLGQRLVRRLATEGATVRVAVRRPERAGRVLDAAGLDRVTLSYADVRDQASVAVPVVGADAVVNAVSAYVEQGGVTFEAVHKQGAETLAQAAAAAGVARFVLVSGIEADPESGSSYIRAQTWHTN